MSISKASRRVRNPFHLALFARFTMLLLSVLFVPCGWGQQNNSSISGTITDASGGSVVGASVNLREPSTGLTRHSTTDGRGYYKFAALSPGSYDISVTKTGFRNFVAKGYTLLVSQDAREDAALQVGAVTATVTVEAEPPLVDNDSAVVGEVFNSKQIVTYPLDGRNFLELATLSAGVSLPASPGSSFAASATGRNTTTIIVGGNRESGTSYLLDGIEMRDDRTGALIYQPSLDALDEFRIQRSFFQAENGFHPSIVNVITKAGTNQFHVTVFDFLRSRSFNAANFFAVPKVPAPYHRNQFGIVFSGPILRDKLQFLFDYEGLRSELGATSNQVFPSENQLHGDFSEPINGKVTPVYDPATPGNRTQFPGNVIPTARISPGAQKIIDLLAPRGLPTTAIGQPNLFGHPVTVQNDDQYIGRLDLPRVRTFRRDTQFTFRLAWLNSDYFRPGNAPLQGISKPIYARNILLQATTILSPDLINVFRIGYQRDFSPTYNIGAYTRNISAEVGLKNTNTYAPDWAAPIIGMTGYGNYGAIQGYNLITVQNAYSLADIVTYIYGNHTFKWGADIRDVRALFDTGTSSMGSVSFGGNFTSRLSKGKIVAGTGNSIADFLLGYPTSASTAVGSTHAHFHYGQFGFFVQDDWKLRPNLMVQAGIRYEPSTYPYPEEGNNYIFDQQTGTLLFPQLHEAPRGLLSSPHHEIGPRLGMSFSPGASGKTTIRGGVGIYFDMTQLNELQFQNFGPPFYYLQQISQSQTSISNKYQLDTNVFPYIAPVPVSVGFTPPQGTSLFSIDPQNKTPTIQQYNVNIQRQLGKHSVFEIGYFGSHGYHLSKRYNFNTCSSAADYLCIPSRRPFPSYGAIFVSSTQGFLHYDSLQTRFEQRFNHGFTMLSSYMWQQGLDNDSGQSESTSTTRAACLECDYGRSEYSVRHRFVTSLIDQLPVGRGRTFGADMPRIADAFIGGWTVSGIIGLQTGPAYNVATSNNSGEAYISNRANCVSTDYYSPHHLHSDPQHQWLNVNAFAATPSATFGNCARGVYTAPGSETVTIGISKNFSLPDKGTILFRGEAFNAFNHANFGIPASGTSLAGVPNFGQISSAGSPRIIQLALKLKF